MSKKDIPLRGHYCEKSLVNRREWLEQKTQTQLDELIETGIDSETLRGNIESYIGTIKVPVGVAGPLTIKGKYVDEDIYAPFATSEGALLSSINRGAKAITLSGGLSCQFISQKMQRAPVFECNSLMESLKLQELIEKSFNDLKEQVGIYTNFGKLENIEFFPLGKTLHCRFNYTTGNAAGQNMTTTVTNQLCHDILEKAKLNKINIQRFLIEGNLSGDKKAGSFNFSHGRGCKVVAEVFLSERIIKRILKTTSDDLLYAIGQFKNGAVSTSTIGFNINTANVVAAIFAATGQDIACSHESSLAHLDVRKEEDGVYCTMMMPSLIIGTVGGGTALPSQQQCLEMMGCKGPNSTYRFAEIICSFALALDLSTASAIASGQFAASHEKLGRNKPGIGFKETDFDLEFFKKINSKISEVQVVDFDSSQSILAQLSSNELSKYCGFKRFNIQTEDKYHSNQIVLKSKPSNNEVANVLEKMASLCEMKLGLLFKQHKKNTIFSYCTSNEIQFYKHYQSVLEKHIPKIEYLEHDIDSQRHLVIMQDISHYPMMNTVFEPKCWTIDNIVSVMQQLYAIHSVLNENKAEFIYESRVDEQLEARELYQSLWEYHFDEFDVVGENVLWLHKIIDNYNQNIIDYFNLDLTVIHNDCNPRNLCFDNDKNLILYDWELITKGHVFVDVVEFLLFMDEQVINEKNIELFVQSYQISANIDWQVLQKCFYFFISQRLALYFMAHNFKDYQFLPRVLDNARILDFIISEKINESN